MAKQFYHDIDLSFELDSTGDIKTLTNNDAMSQSVKINTNTPTGQYPGYGNEGFGLAIKHFLFTQVTAFSAEQIANAIIRQLEKYEPRIELLNVNVENIEEKSYGIDIIYRTRIEEKGTPETFKTVIHTL